MPSAWMMVYSQREFSIASSPPDPRVARSWRAQVDHSCRASRREPIRALFSRAFVHRPSYEPKGKQAALPTVETGRPGLLPPVTLPRAYPCHPECFPGLGWQGYGEQAVDGGRSCGWPVPNPSPMPHHTLALGFEGEDGGKLSSARRVQVRPAQKKMDPSISILTSRSPSYHRALDHSQSVGWTTSSRRTGFA